MEVTTRFCLYLVSELYKYQTNTYVCTTEVNCLCYGMPSKTCLSNWKNMITVSQNCEIIDNQMVTVLLQACKYFFAAFA